MLHSAESLVVRRYDYSWDPRFVGDDAYDHRFGVSFVGWVRSDWTIEDIRIDDYKDGGDYLKINDQRYGSFDQYVRDGLGLSEADITSLRDALLEPAAVATR